jgi:hypothetical protein
MGDMYAQFDLYSVYAIPVGSVGSLVFIQDLLAQLDLYSVYARPIGSVGYI